MAQPSFTQTAAQDNAWKQRCERLRAPRQVWRFGTSNHMRASMKRIWLLGFQWRKPATSTNRGSGRQGTKTSVKDAQRFAGRSPQILAVRAGARLWSLGSWKREMRRSLAVDGRSGWQEKIERRSAGSRNFPGQGCAQPTTPEKAAPSTPPDQQSWDDDSWRKWGQATPQAPPTQWHSWREDSWQEHRSPWNYGWSDSHYQSWSSR